VGVQSETHKKAQGNTPPRANRFSCASLRGSSDKVPRTVPEPFKSLWIKCVGVSYWKVRTEEQYSQSGSRSGFGVKLCWAMVARAFRSGDPIMPG
jgi:hypothetical protein